MRNGYRPSASEAKDAKCCDCLCNYADGRKDCEITKCPVYIRHRYRKLEPTFDWVFNSKWAKHDIKCRVEGLTKKEYIEKYIYANGKPILGTVKMFRAKCFYCHNDFKDGRKDCFNRDCSIYFWMPYRTLYPLYLWMFELDYTEHHRKRAFLEGMYRKVKSDNGRPTIKYNIIKYVKTYLPWHGDAPVKRVRRPANGISE
jgi:hypothetical protein